MECNICRTNETDKFIKFITAKLIKVDSVNLNGAVFTTKTYLFEKDHYVYYCADCEKNELRKYRKIGYFLLIFSIINFIPAILTLTPLESFIVNIIDTGFFTTLGVFSIIILFVFPMITKPSVPGMCLKSLKKELKGELKHKKLRIFYQEEWDSLEKIQKRYN